MNACLVVKLPEVTHRSLCPQGGLF